MTKRYWKLYCWHPDCPETWDEEFGSYDFQEVTEEAETYLEDSTTTEQVRIESTMPNPLDKD